MADDIEITPQSPDLSAILEARYAKLARDRAEKLKRDREAIPARTGEIAGDLSQKHGNDPTWSPDRIQSEAARVAALEPHQKNMRSFREAHEARMREDPAYRAEYTKTVNENTVATQAFISTAERDKPGQSIENGYASEAARLGVAPAKEAPAIVAPGSAEEAALRGVVERREQVAEKERPAKSDFRKTVTDEMIKRIETGTAPWQQQWNPAMGNDRPVNAVTEKPYRGGNAFWLAANTPAGSDGDPRWATYKQAQAQGWQVQKGARGTQIEYWEQVTRTKTDEEIERNREQLRTDKVVDRDGNRVTEPSGKENVLVHRVYTVFHASQIDGIPPHVPEPVHPRYDMAENVAHAVGAEIKVGSGQASYSASRDVISMPPRAAFHQAGGYESVLLHEAGHATGHPDRMNREAIAQNRPFGSPEYAREELRAEMTSAIMSREFGVPHDPSQHAAYAKSWVAALKNDPNELFRAAADAHKIADYMVDRALAVGIPVEVSHERQAAKAPTGPEQTPVKTLGTDAMKWTGRVTEISEDRTQVTMRALGKDAIIKMPESQTAPAEAVPGAYGKLSAARDGADLKFEAIERDRGKAKDKSKGKGMELAI